MTWTAYLLAVLALLLTPGPTNTLLFLAGTQRGWLGALRLIPAELAGYLSVVLPLALLGAQMAAWPIAMPVLSLVAGVWVAILAWRLWQHDHHGKGLAVVTARGVLTTTLLNPKALVFGLVLIPAAPAMTAAAAGFAGLVVAVAAFWAATGALAAGPDKLRVRRIVWLRRGAALWLAALSVGLLAKGLAA